MWLNSYIHLQQREIAGLWLVPDTQEKHAKNSFVLQQISAGLCYSSPSPFLSWCPGLLLFPPSVMHSYFLITLFSFLHRSSSSPLFFLNWEIKLADSVQDMVVPKIHAET